MRTTIDNRRQYLALLRSCQHFYKLGYNSRIRTKLATFYSLDGYWLGFGRGIVSKQHTRYGLPAEVKRERQADENKFVGSIVSDNGNSGVNVVRNNETTATAYLVKLVGSLPVVKKTATFNCPRTCRTCESVDACRFNPLLSMLGSASVNSHTVAIDVKFESVSALTTAIEKLGGSILGLGVHELYGSNTASGFGFTLPGWRYPLVVNADGLNVDEYGNDRESAVTVQTIENEYAIAAANIAADKLGWLCERHETPDGLPMLRVFHPSGGYLDVNAANGVDAFGFNGNGCHSAAMELAEAAGAVVSATAKAEFYNVQQSNQNKE